VQPTGLPAFVYSELPAAMPEGFALVPVDPDQLGAPIRLCVVVRSGMGKSDGGAGGQSAVHGVLVVLRELLDARVYLAALADADGRAHRWCELWVQEIGGLSRAMPAYREAFNNLTLDRRWSARSEALDLIVPGGLIRTGYESSHPQPMFLDLGTLTPTRALDKRTGDAWVLCRDDELLRSKGLGAFSSSLERYLHVPSLGGESKFIPVGAEPSSWDQPGGLGKLLDQSPDVYSINGSGGLIMVAPFAALSYEQYVDALTGLPSAGAPEGLLKVLATLGQTRAQSGGPSGLAPSRAGSKKDSASAKGGLLSLSALGRAGRLVETLHLKVRLLGEAVTAVRRAVRADDAPMLNVTASSFRVSLGEPGIGLPAWWTSRVSLAEPGESVGLAIEGTDAKYYLGGGHRGMSIYAPSTVSRAIKGRAQLRIRRVLTDLNGATGTVIEATLVTQERIVAGTNDLVWMRFSIAGERVDAYAIVESGGNAPGELRVRTIPQRVSGGVAGALKQAEGVPVPEVMFELVPLLSSPCDLYALGVLGVRTFLVDAGTTLPVALDDLMSLASAVKSIAPASAGAGVDAMSDLVARVGKAYSSEERFSSSLGPNRLLAEGFTAGEALGVVTEGVWFRVLATLLRMFPGLLPESRCRDLGDSPAGGLEAVFDEALEDLYLLTVQTRSLVMPDLASNRELRTIVDEYLAVS
jgi:hypothetical protein